MSGEDTAAGPDGIVVLPDAADVVPALWAPVVADRGGRARMIVPVVLALAAHAGVLALALPSEPDQLGDGGTQLEAVAVSIVASVPRAQGALEPVASPSQETPVEEASPPANPEPSKVERVEAAAPDGLDQRLREAQRPKEVAAMTVPPEPEPKAEPVISLPPAETAPPPKALPVPPPEPVVEPPRAKPEPKPLIEPKPEVADKPVVAEPPPVPPAPAATPAPPQRPRAVAVARASAGVMRSYARQVALALARGKPKGVGRRGTVRIRFLIGAGGRSEGASIVQSSGNRRLDQSALAAIGRIGFPKPPADANDTQRTFVVPYEFR